LIKGRQFQSWRSVGVAAQAVRIYQQRGVDELMLLDIGASPEGRGPDLGLIEELSEICFMPLTIAGGIKNVADARRILRAGGDKVAVGKGGWKVIQEIAESLGNQAVIGIIDYDDSKAAQEAAVLYEMAGAGELLLQCKNREGMMQGYDLETISKVSKAVNIPVIASCGAGTYKDLYDAIEAGADAVSAGSMFAFTDQTPKGAAHYLHEHGVPVRI
jgi:cyclase